jgi:hypothetical protein
MTGMIDPTSTAVLTWLCRLRLGRMSTISVSLNTMAPLLMISNEGDEEALRRWAYKTLRSPSPDTGSEPAPAGRVLMGSDACVSH